MTMTTMDIMEKSNMFPSLESWAGSLGYIVEAHDGKYFVHKEHEIAKSFATETDVVDFVLGEIRSSCCGGK